MVRATASWITLAVAITLGGCAIDEVSEEIADDAAAAVALSIPSKMSAQARHDRIRTLQSGRTDSAEEREIVGLFEGAHGDDLHTLKRLLDRGSHRNLLHLVHSDIDDAALRDRLLTHFAAEGSGPKRGLKVLSDIDDTLYANWVDARFPKGTTYPGVRAFYAELGGASGCRSADGGCVVFISARPGDRAGLVEDHTLEALEARGVANPVVLAGDLASLRSHEAMAKRKYENFVRYRQLFPEFDYVFVGDSGQGDAAFGARIRREFPDQVKAVFIHDVVNAEKDQLPMAAEQRAASAADGVFFVDTYVGASAIARDRGLIDAEAHKRIVASAQKELATIDLTDTARAERTRELDADAVR